MNNKVDVGLTKARRELWIESLPDCLLLQINVGLFKLILENILTQPKIESEIRFSRKEGIQDK
jgi:hypothetical protein